jgi:hypothetical protein
LVCVCRYDPVNKLDTDGLEVQYNDNVIHNPEVRQTLENLDFDLPGFDIIVTGGDRYYDNDGKIRSTSNDSWIKNSATYSTHLQGTGVDFKVDGMSLSPEYLSEFFTWTKQDYEDGHYHGDIREINNISEGRTCSEGTPYDKNTVDNFDPNNGVLRF